jgi:predicted DNA-binding transcriptional regulator AlpA
MSQQSPLKLLKVEETAKITGLSVSMMNKMRVYGGGPDFFKLGRGVFYDVRVVEDWIAKHRRASTSQPA